MRTKKGRLVVFALIACLAVGLATVAMAKTKKKRISTTISMTVTASNASADTQASARAYGNVSARGPKGCTKGRRVVIFRNGILVATVLTGKSGEYSVTFTGSSSGNWQAGVTNRVIKRKRQHKKYSCGLAATGVVRLQDPTGPQGTGTAGPPPPESPATVKATLAQVPDFTTAAGGPLFIHNQGNTTVTQTPDGISFGPYPDGGTAGGSVEYTGLNGQPLSAVKSLVYLARYTADDDTGGVGVPYLRIFLGDDNHDAIFSPNTQPPNPDVSQGPFHTWVATSGVWRYDDDGGSGGPGTYGVNGAPYATLQADHGTETISGIYISVGQTAGTNLAALLREWGVNGTTYSFSS